MAISNNTTELHTALIIEIVKSQENLVLGDVSEETFELLADYNHAEALGPISKVIEKHFKEVVDYTFNAYVHTQVLFSYMQDMYFAILEKKSEFIPDQFKTWQRINAPDCIDIFTAYNELKVVFCGVHNYLTLVDANNMVKERMKNIDKIDESKVEVEEQIKNVDGKVFNIFDYMK